MLTPTIQASQTAATNAPFENRRGREQAKRCSRGMHVQGPSERVLLSGKRLSASLGGRGYRASERNNRAMTGPNLSDASPEGRRSGDVGGAGLLSEIETDYRAQPEDAAMIRKTNP